MLLHIKLLLQGSFHSLHDFVGHLAPQFLNGFLRFAVGSAVRGVANLFRLFEGIGATSASRDGLRHGPAVFEDGFALGIKAVDLLDHGGELLFRGGLADGEAVEFVDDGGTPGAQAVTIAFPAARHRMYKKTHTLPTRPAS